MKKKLLSLALMTVFVSLMALGTAAYFNAEGRATNVITTGAVKLELTERFGEGDNWTEDVTEDGVLVGWKLEDTVVPGVRIDKQPVVENIGEQPFWLRARALVTVTGADGQPLDAGAVELLLDDGAAAFPASDWAAKDGWQYCKAEVMPGADKAVTLFDFVQLKPETGNEYQNATVRIAVEVQAVQSANQKDADGKPIEDVLAIKGWPVAE